MLRIAGIDEFKGLWTGLEDHTTALNLLGDVADFGQNFRQILAPFQNKSLTPEIIALLHARQIGAKTPSPYKNTENQISIIGQDGIPVGFLETAPPTQIEPLMIKMLEWLNLALDKRDMHPLLIIAAFAAVFLQIAPFEHGNQKTARFLVLLLLFKSGYSYAPYAPLDHIVSEHAGEVFRALKHNQASLEAGVPDWSVWLECFTGLLLEQKIELEERLKSKEKDLSHLPTLSANIMALFEEHKRLQMKEIIKLTYGRRSTVKLRLGELIKDGYLKRHGQARSTWYSLV